MKINVTLTLDVADQGPWMLGAADVYVRNGVHDIVRDLSEGYTGDVDAYAGTFKVEGIAHTVLHEE